jgi:hypothetical protein
MKFGNGFAFVGCNGCQEEGSSATDSLSSDVKDVRKKEGRRKRDLVA